MLRVGCFAGSRLHGKERFDFRDFREGSLPNLFSQFDFVSVQQNKRSLGMIWVLVFYCQRDQCMLLSLGKLGSERPEAFGPFWLFFSKLHCSMRWEVSM